MTPRPCSVRGLALSPTLWEKAWSTPDPALQGSRLSSPVKNGESPVREELPFERLACLLLDAQLCPRPTPDRLPGQEPPEKGADA